MSLNNSSIFFWYMSFTRGAPNSISYVSVPAKWTLISINVKYCIPGNIGKMSFYIEPLCTDLISAVLSLAGSRNSLTLPSVLGPSTRLLQHFDTLSTLKETIICCICSLINSSFRGSYGVYATILRSTWYIFLILPQWVLRQTVV